MPYVMPCGASPLVASWVPLPAALLPLGNASAAALAIAASTAAALILAPFFLSRLALPAARCCITRSLSSCTSVGVPFRGITSSGAHLLPTTSSTAEGNCRPREPSQLSRLTSPSSALARL